jgi:hypothetical protein
MIRVHVICEGQTEARFVRDLLGITLDPLNIVLIPSMIGRPGHKGGNFRVDRLLPDVRERLLGDTESFCTTFFDFYALSADFPGRKEAEGQRDIGGKASCVETALVEFFEGKLGQEATRRFIPYVQMYEFEALLFSDPEKLARGILKPDMADDFGVIRKQFSTPEHINDNYETAPSKRIGKLCPGYKKPLDGLIASIEIGIDVIRRECRLFDGWLNRLKSTSVKKSKN